MLVRFRQDVIELNPKVVIIQAGTNDLAGLTGPVTDAVFGENLASMTELAKFHGIRVILASMLPVCDCYRKLTSRRPQGGKLSWIQRPHQRLRGAKRIGISRLLFRARQWARF